MSPQSVDVSTVLQHQEDRYGFPYHYVPELTPDGSIVVERRLDWALDYLTYMSFAVDRVDASSPSSVIDVGCGDARLLHMLARANCEKWGVDISERAIGYARAFNPDANLVVGTTADIDRKFDVAAAVEVMEHIPDEQLPEFVEGLHKVVKPEGRLVISVPSVNLPLNKKHFRHYTPELIEQTLSPRFQTEEIHWLSRYTRGSRLLKRLVFGRLWTIRSGRILRAVWRFQRKHYYDATSEDGMHIVCVARPL